MESIDEEQTEICNEQKTSESSQTKNEFDSDVQNVVEHQHLPLDVKVHVINNGVSLNHDIAEHSSSEDLSSAISVSPVVMNNHVDVETNMIGSGKLWVVDEREELVMDEVKPKLFVDQCNNIDNSLTTQNGEQTPITNQNFLFNSNCQNDVCLQMTDQLKLSGSDDFPMVSDYSSGIVSINKDMYNISGCSLDFEDTLPNTPNALISEDGSNLQHEEYQETENPALVTESMEDFEKKLEKNSSSVNLFEPEKVQKENENENSTSVIRSESKRIINRHIVHPYHWKHLDSASKSSVFDSSIDLSFSQDTDHEDLLSDIVPAPGNIDKQWLKSKRSNSSASLDPPEYFDGFGPRSWGCACTCQDCTGGKHSDSGIETLPSANGNVGLLQSQLEKTEKEAKKIQEELKAEIKELKKDNERQQKLIGQNLSLGPEAKIEATMQHEITRLTSENLDLREEIDKHTNQIRMLKKMVKVYSKKLQAGEAAEIQAELERAESIDSNGSLATVKQKERAFMGMLELKKEDEGTLIKNLILDLKPKVAAGLIPGLPAYVLFMIVRQTDFTNDDEKVRGLLTNTINGIKKVVKRHNDDLERITLWLANTCRLLHTLKQYSGEKAFQTENTPKQNEQCLRNFDLSEYRQVFSDLAVWIYQGLLKRMEELIQPSIVPAILEHEAISGLNASKPSGLRGRASSNARELDGNDYTLDSLMKALNNYMRIVTQHAVDPELAKQIFRQVFYYICAGSLNNLLLRKDMCNWSKGMQIRYNLSHLEQWLRDNKLHESGAIIALDPIIQASQLLQARKTDSDVESISDMCSKLTNAQIVKILNLYTPVDEFEERVPISFIRKIQEKLKSRDDTNNTLLMDTKYSYPVTFPFNPSNIQLESIEVPDVLHLSMLKKV
ncbi:hypothetical protein SNE40_007184 [Patella caerulea]|uniref:Dilute domain-containing protein n=1 Tax=Patella caerulea TaxID=87958 RepID=A0AAN8PTE1_PATCE